MSDSRDATLDRRTVLHATFGAIGATIVSGVGGASQHDVDVSFSDEQAIPGENVQVSFDVDPANDPGAEVSSYNAKIDYDPSDLSFVEATGEALPDPSENDDPSTGTLQISAFQATGASVPLTVATLTFGIASDARPGDTATISLVDGESSFNDQLGNAVTFESQNGTVTVSGSSFDVSITDTNAPVFEGETLVVQTLIENVGTEEDTQSISLLDFAGDSADSEAVTIQGGNDTSIDLNWATTAGDAGTDEVTVESENDTATRTVEIRQRPAVTASIGDETAAPGDEVTVVFGVDPDSDNNAEVGAYDIRLTYDESVVSFVEAAGVDFPDPTVTEPSTGTVTADAEQSSGDPVPLTPAEFTFSIDGDAADGDSTAISFVTDQSELTDPTDEVPASFENGSVTVNESGGGSLIGYQVGDVNTDDERGIVDAFLIQQHVVGLGPEPFAPELADVRRTGDITIVDAFRLQRYLVGSVGDREVEVTDLTAGNNTVTAQLANTGGLGAWDEAQLWVVAQNSNQAAILEEYSADDPPSPDQLADDIRTSEFDLSPDGEQGSVQFDVSDLAAGTYRGLVYTGDDADTLTFSVN